MGLPGVPYETALACSDKALMKARFEAGGVAWPQVLHLRRPKKHGYAQS